MTTALEPACAGAPDPAVFEPEATIRAALGRLAQKLPTHQRIRALHALARARVELGEAAAARGAMRSAQRLADEANLRLPELRLTMAWIELDSGRVSAAVRELDHVPDDPRALCLRGLASCAAGNQLVAERMLTAAINQLTDQHWLANALCGRGIVRSYRLLLAAADADFATAQALFTSAGAAERATTCLHNRGFVALRAADLPRALRLFDDAERAGLRTTDRAEALVDRANALLAGGLLDEAAEVLDRAARLLGDAGRGMTFAEAKLALARCALLSGAADTAIAAATEAAKLFQAQGRPGWLAVARAVQLRGQLTQTPDLATHARSLADRCRQAGWPVEAADLLLTAADHVSDSTDLLTQVARERTAGTAALRAAGWLARARLAPDQRGVYAACRAGLRVVDEQVGLMGSLELQAGVGALGNALADKGLRAALRSGRPRQVLRWTDRCRAMALRVAPVRPPDDPALAADLVRLRAAKDDLARTAQVERDVRRRVLTTAGRAILEPADVDLDELAEQLGERAFLSFVEHRGELLATSMVRRTVRLHRIGANAALRNQLERLRFGLTLGIAGGRGASSTRRSARGLDDGLFGNLRRFIGDRPLVVVPTRWMQAVPWAALPSCAGRPVSSAPSALSWSRAASLPAPGPRSVWLAGPGLTHATDEVSLLCGRFGGTALAGADCTAAAALSAMDGAGLAHVAAHGRFRSDAPMFSSLTLADGPLHGYDLDRLTDAPRVLVLSACDVGKSVDPSVGLTPVLLRRGTAALIASTLPVPDNEVSALAGTLHAGLHAGRSPASALAEAQLVHGHLGFGCYGAG